MRWTMGFLASCVVAACAGPSASPVETSVRLGDPVDVVLRLGQETQIPGTVLRVTLTDVLEDSRCPVDVTCVWAGNVRVGLGVAAGSGPSSPFQLNTNVEPRIAEWNGVRFTVRDVGPEARSTVSIDPRDYTVTLHIEAAR